MTLKEYLIARRAVETADRSLVKQAEELAERVKAKNLPTIAAMWDEMIKLSEPPQRELFKIL